MGVSIKSYIEIGIGGWFVNLKLGKVVDDEPAEDGVDNYVHIDHPKTIYADESVGFRVQPGREIVQEINA